MTDIVASDWCAFVTGVKDFLGNNDAEYYEKLVQNMPVNFGRMGHLVDFQKTIVISVKNKGSDSIKTESH